MNAEQKRLATADSTQGTWRLWGPYLSERQWGTVREDYSPYGNAWEYFPHDHARSRAYRWGEDGWVASATMASAFASRWPLWNGKDPILKERIFGLTNSEGNHGEDAKELYYYLDATPTHSYLKMLYKYPQREFPYARLVEENRRRGKDQPEFELLDTGIFDDDRYFDVFIEYAKAGPMTSSCWSRSTTADRRQPTIHVAAATLVPQHLVLESQQRRNPNSPRQRTDRLRRSIPNSESYQLHCEGKPTLLFCDNETNVRRLYGQNDAPGYFKDAFHEYVVNGNKAAVNPERNGTKAAALYRDGRSRRAAPQRIRLPFGAKEIVTKPLR